MTRYRVEVALSAVDQDAAELNAALLDQGTMPALSGQFVTDVEADSPEEAIRVALSRVPIVGDRA